MEQPAPNVLLYRYNCADPYNCPPFQYEANPGRYKLECWGAQGGNLTTPASVQGGKGGYASGILTVTKKTTLYIFPGEKGIAGSDFKYTRTTFGQGGQGYGPHSSYYQTSGGGMSFISLNSPTNSSGIIFAAGGGGSGFGTAYGYGNKPYLGGFGGGLEGQSGENYNNILANKATGGTQTSGGVSGSDTNFGYPEANGGQYYGGSAKKGGYASGGGGGYYGGAAGNNNAAAGAGGSSYVDPSLSDAKNIPGNDTMPSQYSLDSNTTGNSGDGAVRITILGYILMLRNPLQESYKSDSTIFIDLSLPSLGEGEIATINRSFDNEKMKNILIHNDDENLFEFSDNFSLPKKPGNYSVVYTVTNKLGTENSLKLWILVNSVPKLEPLSEMKEKYKSGEQGVIGVRLLDDSFSTIVMYDESIEYRRQKLYCYINGENRTTLYFTIPNYYEVGTTHNVTIVAHDEFNFESNIISFRYKIVDNISPDVQLRYNISYYTFKSRTMGISANIRDLDSNTNVCLMTTIDNINLMYHECKLLTNNQWSPAEGRIYLANDLEYGIHTLRIFSMDDQGGESNKIVHRFTLLSPYVCANICTHNSMFNFNMVLLAILIYLKE